MKKQEVYTVNDALKKLMRYCAYQERCHKEVEQKLKLYHLTPLEKQEVIYQLIKDNFLNEERFTIAFVRDKFNLQHWGKQRITRELKYRHISDHLIQKGLKEIDEKTYLKTFKTLFDNKLKQLDNQKPIQKKRKIIDYLVRKGYEYELIFDTVSQLDSY